MHLINKQTMKKPNDITNDELAEVFKAERPRLLRYACYRMAGSDDAEDVLQETFLKLHARLSDTDGGQINDLPSYLFRTLANLCTKWQANASCSLTILVDSLEAYLYYSLITLSLICSVG